MASGTRATAPDGAAANAVDSKAATSEMTTDATKRDRDVEDGEIMYDYL